MERDMERDCTLAVKAVSSNHVDLCQKYDLIHLHMIVVHSRTNVIYFKLINATAVITLPPVIRAPL